MVEGTDGLAKDVMLVGALECHDGETFAGAL